MKKEKEQAYAQIMHMFRYQYKSKWAPENIFDNRSRTWIQAFNELVKKGFIIKKKKFMGYKYKWGCAWPKDY